MVMFGMVGEVGKGGKGDKVGSVGEVDGQIHDVGNVGKGGWVCQVRSDYILDRQRQTYPHTIVINTKKDYQKHTIHLSISG